MALINPAMTESVLASDAKKVSERRAVEIGAVRQGAPESRSPTARTPGSRESRLSFLQEHLEHMIDNALRDPPDRDPISDERAASYRRTEVNFTPQTTADRVVSRALGYFKAYRGENPDKGKSEALRSFVADVRAIVAEGFREAVAMMNALGALDLDAGRAFMETDAEIRKRFDRIAPEAPAPAPAPVPVQEPQ